MGYELPGPQQPQTCASCKDVQGTSQLYRKIIRGNSGEQTMSSSIFCSIFAKAHDLMSMHEKGPIVASRSAKRDLASGKHSELRKRAPLAASTSGCQTVSQWHTPKQQPCSKPGNPLLSRDLWHLISSVQASVAVFRNDTAAKLAGIGWMPFQPLLSSSFSLVYINWATSRVPHECADTRHRPRAGRVARCQQSPHSRRHG